MDALTRHCISWLRHKGYEVLEPGSMVIMDTSYVVSAEELRSLRSGSDRWADIALEANMQRLNRRIINNGLCAQVRKDMPDGSVVFGAGVGIVKPLGNAS